MKKLKNIYIQFRRMRIFFFTAFMASTLFGLVLIDLLQELIDTAVSMDMGRFKGFVIQFLLVLGDIWRRLWQTSIFSALLFITVRLH